MHRIDEKDRLKGGVDAENLGKYLKRFDPKEVKMGVKDEKEHTKDPRIAAEIASDHLSDSPHYYSRLKAAHIESTDVFEFNFHDIIETEDPDDVPIGAKISIAAPAVVKKVEPKVVSTEKREPGRPRTKISANGEWAREKIKGEDGKWRRIGASNGHLKVRNAFNRAMQLNHWKNTRVLKDTSEK